jgi:hypothetical protein
MAVRKRSIGSVRNELIAKSKEAMLSAVQIYNNPIIQFKSESFIVLAIIAWTYLLHAYYRGIREDYRYYIKKGERKFYKKTNFGAFRHWELEKCLDCSKSPIDKITKENLLFLIGLRHEIEHQMTTKIDNSIWERFQACCINYNKYLGSLFGNNRGIEDFQPVSLQFSSISETQLNQVYSLANLPKNISSYITDFDTRLTNDEINDKRFALKLAFIQSTVNRTGQADRVIEFIRADSPEALGLDKESIVIKPVEKPKYIMKQILQMMHDLGYIKFNRTQFITLYKTMDGKNPEKGYGTMVYKNWYWYDTWVEQVKKHCLENKEIYRS